MVGTCGQCRPVELGLALETMAVAETVQRVGGFTAGLGGGRPSELGCQTPGKVVGLLGPVEVVRGPLGRITGRGRVHRPSRGLTAERWERRRPWGCRPPGRGPRPPRRRRRLHVDDSTQGPLSPVLDVSLQTLNKSTQTTYGLFVFQYVTLHSN